MSYIEKDLRRAAKMDRSCWTSELLITAADRIAELEVSIADLENREEMNIEKAIDKARIFLGMEVADVVYTVKGYGCELADVIRAALQETP